MVRVRARLSGFCMSRAVARVRGPSPSHHYKKTNSLIRPDEKNGFFSSNGSEMSFSCYVSKPPDDSESGNRVMVVVDYGVEAKGALQWALSHTVQTEDTIILLHVTKPPKPGEDSSIENQRAFELLRSMKNLCLDKGPGVNVEIALQEGKEKGPVIVEAAKQLKVSLLALGQKKISILWRLRMIWPGTNRTKRSRAVDYCIQNANCMTIAVRRKGKKYGGYLITTKRHKNFWLLA